MRLYLSGPMGGLPNNNFEEFHVVARMLRNEGHEVFNPAETELPPDFGTNEPANTVKHYKYFLPIDAKAVCESEAVVLLKGWGSSKGCALEISLARMCELPVLNAYTLQPITWAQEAHEYVHGSRRRDYGHPFDDYTRTAAYANIRLADKLKEPLTPEDCIAFMQMVKLSRLTNTPGHRDSNVDYIGYMLCEDLVREERKRRENAILTNNPGKPGIVGE